MDLVDKNILLELIQNCRISYRELGKKVNLSPSSVKKRIDGLENSGFIDHYKLLLNPDLTNLRIATLMVNTDASIKIETFKEIVMQFQGVYMILPLISGDFYVSLDYENDSDLKNLTNLIKSIDGVQNIELYDVLPPGAQSDFPRTPTFSRSELIILGQLAINPRMMDFEIGLNLGWSTKKVKQILQTLEAEGKVVFGARWNPNLGRDIAFNLIIKYDSDLTSARNIIDRLSKDYPIQYFNSRVVESRATIFAVFTMEKIVDMEPVAMAVFDYAGVTNCFAITYYNAIIGKTKNRLRLEELLEKEGLWKE